MTTAPALLQDLAGRGVVLMADAGKLRYRAPAGTLTPDLRRQLEAHKAALVALLTSDQQAGLFDAIPAQDLTKHDSRQETGAAPALGPADRGRWQYRADRLGHAPGNHARTGA